MQKSGTHVADSFEIIDFTHEKRPSGQDTENHSEILRPPMETVPFDENPMFIGDFRETQKYVPDDTKIKINIHPEIVPTININEVLEKELNCEIIYFDEKAIMKYAIALILLLIGLQHAFLGHRHFRLTSFLSGLLGVFIISFSSLSNRSFGDNFAISSTTALIISTIAGVAGGLITSMVDYVGLFLSGFYFGVFGCGQVLFMVYFFGENMSLAANFKERVRTDEVDTLTAKSGIAMANFINDDGDQNQIHPNDESQVITLPSELKTLIILTSSGLIFALITLFKPKHAVIFSTAQTGAILMTLAVDIIVENLKMTTQLFFPTILSGTRVDNVCQYTIYIWLCSLVLTILTVLFQLSVTVKKGVPDNEYEWWNDEIFDYTKSLGRGTKSTISQMHAYTLTWNKKNQHKLEAMRKDHSKDLIYVENRADAVYHSTVSSGPTHKSVTTSTSYGTGSGNEPLLLSKKSNFSGSKSSIHQGHIKTNAPVYDLPSSKSASPVTSDHAEEIDDVNLNIINHFKDLDRIDRKDKAASMKYFSESGQANKKLSKGRKVKSLK